MTDRYFDLSKYSDYLFYNFRSIDEFCSIRPKHGISQILIGSKYLHALFIDRNAETTLVHFGAALPPKGWDTYPNFLGLKSGSGFRVNHLLLSDPSYALPGRLPTGWFAGSEGQDLQSNLEVIISHFSSIGNTNQCILFGSSAGGFASIYYGSKMEGSLSISVNPRTDLRVKPTQYYRLAPKAFPMTNAKNLDTRVHVSAGDQFSKSSFGTVAYIQNIQDTPYFEGNLIPFLEANPASNRVWLLLVDSGPGHVMPKGSLVSDLFGSLTENAPEWGTSLSNLGFIQAPSVEYALHRRDELLSISDSVEK